MTRRLNHELILQQLAAKESPVKLATQHRCSIATIYYIISKNKKKQPPKILEKFVYVADDGHHNNKDYDNEQDAAIAAIDDGFESFTIYKRVSEYSEKSEHSNLERFNRKAF